MVAMFNSLKLSRFSLLFVLSFYTHPSHKAIYTNKYSTYNIKILIFNNFSLFIYFLHIYIYYFYGFSNIFIITAVFALYIPYIICFNYLNGME